MFLRATSLCKIPCSARCFKPRDTSNKTVNGMCAIITVNPPASPEQSLLPHHCHFYPHSPRPSQHYHIHLNFITSIPTLAHPSSPSPTHQHTRPYPDLVGPVQEPPGLDETLALLDLGDVPAPPLLLRLALHPGVDGGEQAGHGQLLRVLQARRAVQDTVLLHVDIIVT